MSGAIPPLHSCRGAQLKKSTAITEEINTDPVEKKLALYKQKRLNYVSRMECIRCQAQFFDCRPLGGRRPGWTLN